MSRINTIKSRPKKNNSHSKKIHYSDCLTTQGFDMKLNRFSASKQTTSFRKTLVALAIPLATSSGHAAILTVNSTGDGGAGCTLREAVQSANANANLNNGCGIGSAIALDTIEFLVPNVELANGEITISDDLQVNTVGSNVTINANGTSRIFNISNASVTLNDLTLTGGNGSDGNSSYGEGGAVYVGGGSLVMQNCVVHSNTAATNAGGGISGRADLLSISNSRIYNNVAQSAGGIADRDNTLTIVNSQITSNTATYYGSGGMVVGSYQATITSSTVSGNTGVTEGGGIFFDRTDASILNSTISNNYLTGQSDGDFFGGRGGGLAAEDSSLVITNSKIESNIATASGGGLYGLASDIRLVNSTISGNNALALGEYSTAIGGGGIFITMRSSSFGTSNSQIYLYGSTVDNNHSARDGGGILIAPEDGNGSADVIAINSTISKNSSTYLGAGVHQINDGDFGGYAATMSANVSTSGAGGISASGADAELALANSIVAGNRSTSSSHEIRLTNGASLVLGSEDNIFGQSEFTTVDSFFGLSISAANFFATSDGNNRNPLSQRSAPLQNNGGRTRSHALPRDSIAIDNGGAPVCNLVGTTDQRGPNNRNDGQCDIGSVEYFEDTCFVVPTADNKVINFCL